MLKVFQWLDRNYTLFSKVVGGLLVGIIILIMMSLNLGEIVFRNAGNPTLWTSELGEIMILWVFVLPLFFTQMSGGMIRITFLTSKFPPKVRPWVDLLGSLSALVFGVILFMSSFKFLQMTPPGGYFTATHFPVGLQRGLIPVFALLLAIAGLLCLTREILQMRGYSEGAEGRNKETKQEST